MNTLTRYINSNILDLSKGLRYTVKDVAPSTFQDVSNESSLIVWSGASDATIYQDASVNYAFRALHDAMHIETGLGFDAIHEMELGRIQASKVHALTGSELLATIVHLEVSGQAEHYLKTGQFIEDQISFIMKQLKGL